MPPSQPEDPHGAAGRQPAALSEALACELAMLEATLLPTPGAEPPQRAPPPEEPEQLAGR